MAQDKDIKIIAEKVCVTTTGLCEILCVDKSTLTRWEQQGCPKIQRGWWSVKDVLDWRSASYDKDKNPEEMHGLEKKIYYEGELKKAQLENIDLKNQIAKGEYIAKGEVVTELQRFLVVLKKSMDGFSQKITTELSHLVETTEARRIKKIVQDVTTGVLEQLSIDGVYEAKGKKKNTI